MYFKIRYSVVTSAGRVAELTVEKKYVAENKTK